MKSKCSLLLLLLTVLALLALLLPQPEEYARELNREVALQRLASIAEAAAKSKNVRLLSYAEILRAVTKMNSKAHLDGVIERKSKEAQPPVGDKKHLLDILPQPD